MPAVYSLTQSQINGIFRENQSLKAVKFVNPDEDWHTHRLFLGIFHSNCIQKIGIRAIGRSKYKMYILDKISIYMNKNENCREVIYKGEMPRMDDYISLSRVTKLHLKYMGDCTLDELLAHICKPNSLLKELNLPNLGIIKASYILATLKYITSTIKFSAYMNIQEYIQLLRGVCGENICLYKHSPQTLKYFYIKLRLRREEDVWRISKYYYIINQPILCFPFLSSMLKYKTHEKLIISYEKSPTSYKQYGEYYSLIGIQIISEELRNIQWQINCLKLNYALPQPSLRKLLFALKMSRVRYIYVLIHPQWSAIWKVIANTYPNKWIKMVVIIIKGKCRLTWPKLYRDKDLQRYKFFRKIRGIKERIPRYYIHINSCLFDDDEKYANPNIQFR